MNGELKPTPLPNDLRSALHVILDRMRYDDYFDVRLELRDDLLGDALEVIRCHLVGIDSTACDAVAETQVRGEGWSL